MPQPNEDIRRTLHAVLISIFNGNTHSLGGVDVECPLCTLAFDTRERSEKTQEHPTIVIGQATDLTVKEEKCADPTGARPFAYERRSKILAPVLVAVGLNGPEPLQSRRQADRVYDILVTVFAVKHRLLSQNNIFSPRLSLPLEIPHDKIAQLSGNLAFEYRFVYYRDDT